MPFLEGLLGGPGSEIALLLALGLLLTVFVRLEPEHPARPD